jgi:hypothetical protein
MNAQAHFTLAKVIRYEDLNLRPKVFIVDLDVGKSITNDAENVVEQVAKEYPGHRIIYRDTQGQWDELVHNDGEFVGFAPYHEELP